MLGNGALGNAPTVSVSVGLGQEPPQPVAMSEVVNALRHQLGRDFPLSYVKEVWNGSSKVLARGERPAIIISRRVGKEVSAVSRQT